MSDLQLHHPAIPGSDASISKVKVSDSTCFAHPVEGHLSRLLLPLLGQIGLEFVLNLVNRVVRIIGCLSLLHGTLERAVPLVEHGYRSPLIVLYSAWTEDLIGKEAEEGLISARL